MRNMLLFSFQKKPIGLRTLKFWAILLGFLLVYPLSAQNDLWIPKADLGDGTSGMKRTGAVSFTISGKVYIALGKDGSTYQIMNCFIESYINLNKLIKEPTVETYLRDIR